MAPHAGKAFVVDGRTGGTPGPATTTPATIDIPGDITNRTFSRHFRIHHVAGAGNLLVSLDGQPPFIMSAGQVIELPAAIQSMEVTASSGTVEYDCIVIV